MERFAGTAVLDQAHARDLGVVGVVGRASGLAFDARIAHPLVDLGRASSRPHVQTGGDVLARFSVRVDEVRASLSLLADLIDRSWRPRCRVTRIEDGAAVGSASDGRGRDRRGRGVGPSCTGSSSTSRAGWPGSRWSTRPSSTGRRCRCRLTDTIVPDFPLANKSFNLSYAGNDL